MLEIIDGRALAKKHEEALRQRISNFKFQISNFKVVSILIGEDPASELYTKLKQKKAGELGIEFEPLRFSVKDDFYKVADEIMELNNNPEVKGIMIQLPIPTEFLKEHQWTELTYRITPEKDVDGLVPGSLFLSATAKAVLAILEDENVEVSGKKVIVIGRSDLVGKPVAEKLRGKGALVETIHRSTENPARVSATADILISAAGSPKLVKENWVKEGAVVIDVGTSELEGKIVGDVDFEAVKNKVSKITPVPGGVGPMTVISLMENVVESLHGFNG